MNARTDIPLGVIDAMPAEEYHSIAALSAGGLKRLRQSPLHFWAAQVDPDRIHGDPTAAMRNGTLVHCLVLEPDAVEVRYMVKPEGLDGRTKEGKTWLASVPPQTSISGAEEMAAACRQAAAIRALPEVAALLDSGRSEVSAFWRDPVTGELSKCRPDKVSPAGRGVILLDVKTCQDASPAGFAKAIANFDYHLQDAWYSDGFAIASGLPVLGFVFAVVESTPPHAAAAYMIDDEARERARDLNTRLRQLYADCRRSNAWPGYPNTVQPLSLPPWAFN